MYKTTDETKLFVRFLKEKGIKYSYAEETLRYERIKKHEWKMYSNLLNDEVGGNLLKYLDSLFSRHIYNVIHYSFSWVNTKKGRDFWTKMEVEWEWDYILQKTVTTFGQKLKGNG